MAPIRHTILFLISFAALISVRAVSGASDHSLSYIYYYANIINAIVVERADGTDSRAIIPGAMPADNSVIDNLAWSPSGEWMAWRSSVYSPEGGAGAYSGWIARSDGSERLTLLDAAGNRIIKMQWSPTRDWLYVAYSHELKLILMIIDVDANKILAQTDYQSTDSLWGEGFTSGWLSAGEGAYAVLGSGDLLLLSILYADNRTSMRAFGPRNKQRPLANIVNGRLLSYDIRYWMPSTQLQMEDLSSGKTVLIDSLPRDTPQQQGFRVDWEPTMRYALIYYWECPPDSYCYGGASPQVYLLNWEQGTLQFLAARVIPGGDFDEQSTNFQPPSAVWSPDGRYAVLRDSLHHVMVVDATSGQLSSVDVPSVIAWQWAAKAEGLVLLSNNRRRLYHYDLKAQTTSAFPQAVVLDRGSWFSVSPDNRFVGFIRPGLHNYDMVDLQTQTKRRWPHHTLGSSAGPIINFLWDKNSQWFMTGEYTTFAGGGPGLSAVTLFNTAGTVRREISFCGYVGKCAGFVQDRALPHLGEGSPTSVIPEPAYSLVHYQQVLGVAWSPNGSQLASYSGGQLHIWDVSGTPKPLSSYPVESYCYPHPIPCHLAWHDTTISLGDGKTIETVDISTGTQIDKHEIEYFRTVIDRDLTYIALSPDGKTAAYTAFTSWSDPVTMLVDTARNLTVRVSNLPAGPVWWAGDSQTLFLDTGEYASGKLLLWNAGKIRLLDAPYGIYSADARPAGKYIFGASMYHPIYVWDAATGQRLDDLNWYAKGVALSPDGTRLAAIGSSLVTIWDVADLQAQGE